ncbi:MAG: beta-1,3-glucanase family protein [Flavipsychrobacter sp.]
MKLNSKSIFAALLYLFLFCLQAQAKYYPLKIVDYTGNTKGGIHAYMIFLAQDTTTAANHCVLELTYDSTSKLYKGSLVKIDQNTNSSKYTYRLDKLKGFNKKTKSVTVLIPNTISGRCMVSLNYPLYMPPVQSTVDSSWSLQAPSASNITDVNYDIIYDKFEFTYNLKNTMYIDPTAVDFFAIPIGLKSSNDSSGPPPNANRPDLLKTIIGVLDSNKNKKWRALEITDSNTVLRIDAPYMSPNFDTSYLTGNTYNYIDSLTKYYESNILKINCDELRDTGGQIFDTYHTKPQEDPGAYMFTSKKIKKGLWVFTNKPKKGKPIVVSINMNQATSFNFFAPGTSPFLTTNKMVISIIVKNITAAFTVGLLPAPDSMLIDDSYINDTTKYPYYKYNKQLKAPKITGPWYNLYTKALHKAIPQIYAFAFDDVLGQSGTLISSDNSDTITLTLCDMGNIKIPKHSSLLPVYADTLIYNSGFVHIGNQYIDTLRWKVPNNQPSNAQYFFMGAGPGFTITPEQFLSFQYGNFFSSTDTIGWVAIPDSLFGNCSNPMIPMTVNSCGGPNTPCPTSSNWQQWQKSVSYNLMPSIDSPVYPVVATYNGGFSKKGNYYVDTVKWTVPSNQPSTANYFFMGSGSGFTIPPDTFVYYQAGTQYSGKDTVGIIRIPTSVFNNQLPQNISIQVMTCGGPGHPCPTKKNINYWQCASGSNIEPPKK